MCVASNIKQCRSSHLIESDDRGGGGGGGAKVLKKSIDRRCREVKSGR